LKLTGGPRFGKFRFIGWESLKQHEGWTLERDLASPLRYLDYLDPFNCECRAYGRLRAENREDLAVRAHGYLLLTPEQEAEIAALSWNVAGESDSDEPAPDEGAPPEGIGHFPRWEEHLGVPVRAIVKDLALADGPWTPEQQPAIWRDLEDLHGLGILVGDITVFNYIGGKLVDLGHSWTMPHPCLDYISDFCLAEARQKDPLQLQRALVDWGIANRWTKADFSWRPEELKKCASGKGEGDPFGTDPLLYDWTRCEEDVDAAEDFWDHEVYAPLPEPEPEQQTEAQAETARGVETETEAETRLGAGLGEEHRTRPDELRRSAGDE
jgi:hypothetical protein